MKFKQSVVDNCLLDSSAEVGTFLFIISSVKSLGFNCLDLSALNICQFFAMQSVIQCQAYCLLVSVYQLITIKLTGLGGAMVQHACSNGHAICKNLGSSPTNGQWSFSPVTRFLHSTIEPQRQHPCRCALVNQLNAIRGACKTSNNKKDKVIIIQLLLPAVLSCP